MQLSEKEVVQNHFLTMARRPWFVIKNFIATGGRLLYNNGIKTEGRRVFESPEMETISGKGE